MLRKCCVPACKGKYSSGPKVSVFLFRRDEDLREKWIKAIHRDEFVPSKESVGSTEWGVSNTPYTPRPDLVAVEKLVNMKRMLQKRQMPLSLVVTDPARRQEVDDFYLAAQLHRDQYKDHTGKLHPLVYFKNPELRWKCAPDFMKIYMKCPQYYVKYRDPLVLPKTLARTFPCPPLPERSLAGRRNKHSDYAYKR